MVPGREGTVVRLERAEVDPVHRRQRVVEPAASQRGCPAYQQLVRRRKHHRREPAHVVRQPRDALLVAPDLLAGGAEFDRHGGLAEPFVFQFASDGGPGLPVRDQQARLGRAKRTQRGEEARRLEQVGLPLPVSTDQELLPPVTDQAREGEITPVLDGDFAQMHGR